MHAQLKAILCRTSTKNSYAMHTMKILLTYYLNVSVQAANLSDCRIESKLFFARIGMLYCQAAWNSLPDNTYDIRHVPLTVFAGT